MTTHCPLSLSLCFPFVLPPPPTIPLPRQLTHNQTSFKFAFRFVFVWLFFLSLLPSRFGIYFSCHCVFSTFPFLGSFSIWIFIISRLLFGFSFQFTIYGLPFVWPFPARERKKRAHVSSAEPWLTLAQLRSLCRSLSLALFCRLPVTLCFYLLFFLII